jgi:hypothetical protein
MVKIMIQKISTGTDSPKQLFGSPITVERRMLHEEVLYALRQWLQGQKPGTRLPAERRLAREMEVSRPTLRKAMDGLLKSGEIERVGRKTFVGKGSPLNGTSLEGHPFIYADIHPPRPATTTLQMAIFETLRSQKRCWTRLCDRFNETHENIQLELHDLSVEVKDTAQYASFIRQEKMDLVQLQPAMLQPLREAGILKPLPLPVAEEVGSDASLWTTLNPDSATPSREMYGAPLHTGFFLLAWNTALTGPDFKPPEDAMDARTALQWYRQAAALIPVGRWVAANPADLVALVGYDFDAWSPAAVQTYIGEAVDIGLDLMAIQRDRFLCDASDRRFGLRAFTEGRTAFVLGPSYLLLEVLRSAALPWQASVAMPPTPYQAPAGATLAGITVDGDRGGAAGEVVRFLVSDVAQSMIAEEGLNCPIRQDSVTPLTHFLGLDSEPFLRQMRRLRLAQEGLPLSWNWFTHYRIMPYLNEMIGKLRRPDREAMIAHLSARCTI